VIGGAGAIGSFVVRRLSAAGHQVTVVRRSTAESELPREVCSAAIHMYAMSANDGLAFVRDFGPSADRLVLISSGDVYRAYGVIHRQEPTAIDPSPLTEDAPLRSVLNLYPQFPDYDKIPVERIVMQAGEHNCVLRLPAVYGPGDSHHRAGGWLKSLPHITAGYARWRWTHGYIENVAEAIALAAENERSAGRIYNVGEPETPTMLERIERFAGAFGWRGGMAIVPEEPSALEYRQHLIMDSRRIRDQLGFQEVVSAAEACRRTVDWEVNSGYVSSPS
jgi:nucleoside-diphosphate-sugar epimerase